MGRREAVTANHLARATASRYAAAAAGLAQCCNVCGSVSKLHVGCYRGAAYYYCPDHETIYRKLKARENCATR